MRNNTKEFFKYIFITILCVILLCVFPYINYKKLEEKGKLPKEIVKKAEIEVEFGNKKTALELFSDKYNISEEQINTIKINEKYSFYSANINDKLETEIINTDTAEISDINSIIKDGKSNLFTNLINTEIDIKYPQFISNALKNKNTIQTYEFKEDGINILFNNYETNPVYLEKTSVKLTCKMIDEILDYECNSIVEEDPNIPILDPDKKTVAITFDDGPAKSTDEIIDILDSNKANATFFIVGRNANIYINTIKKAIEYGNEIGLHSYSHKNFNKCSNEELEYELNTFHTNLSNLINYDTKLVRPPYGNINDSIKENYNYIYILWSLDTEDWKIKDKNTVKERVLEKVKDGDIILFHDIHLSTKEALKEILPELYVRGYQVVTVSKLAELKNTSLETNKIYRKF